MSEPQRPLGKLISKTIEKVPCSLCDGSHIIITSAYINEDKVGTIKVAVKACHMTPNIEQLVADLQSGKLPEGYEP